MIFLYISAKQTKLKNHLKTVGEAKMLTRSQIEGKHPQTISNVSCEIPVEGIWPNPFNLSPIDQPILNELYQIGMTANIGRNGDKRFIIETLPDIDSSEKRKKWIQFKKSRLLSKQRIPESATIVTITKNAIPKSFTFLSKYNAYIKNGYGGTVIDIPNDFEKGKTDFVTYGPYFSYPHKDELAIGGIVSLPVWIESNVMKLWIFSTSTVYRMDSLLNYRVPTAKESYNTKINFVAKSLLLLVKDGLAIVIVQKRGERFTFEGGHTHAVITAFESAEDVLPISIMITEFNYSNVNIAHSNNMINECKKSNSPAAVLELKARTKRFNEVFNKVQIKAYKKRISSTVTKRKMTIKEMLKVKLKKQYQLKQALAIRHSRSKN